MQAILKAELAERNWRYRELTRELRLLGANVGESTVRAWLEGRCIPSYRNALAIARVFDWTLADMLRNAGYADDPSTSEAV